MRTLALNSAYTNSNNTLFIDVTNFSILQHRCDVIDFGQTLMYEMCVMRYLTCKTSTLLQMSRVFLKFHHGDYETLLLVVLGHWRKTAKFSLSA